MSRETPRLKFYGITVDSSGKHLGTKEKSTFVAHFENQENGLRLSFSQTHPYSVLSRVESILAEQERLYSADEIMKTVQKGLKLPALITKSEIGMQRLAFTLDRMHGLQKGCKNKFPPVEVPLPPHNENTP